VTGLHSTAGSVSDEERDAALSKFEDTTVPSDTDECQSKHDIKAMPEIEDAYSQRRKLAGKGGCSSSIRYEPKIRVMIESEI
jgi:hypothetical protein